MTPVDEIERPNGYTVRVYVDESAESPLRLGDEPGRMYGFNREYDLGDANEYDDEQGLLEDLAYKARVPKREWDNIPAALDKRGWLIMPLRLHDHGATSLYCYQSGYYIDGADAWYVIRPKELRHEWGGSPAAYARIGADAAQCNATPKDRGERYVRGLVRMYSDYLSGAVFGYKVAREGAEVEAIEGSWCYYGYDHQESGLLEAADEEIAYHWEEVCERQTRELLSIGNPLPDRGETPVRRILLRKPTRSGGDK